MSLRIEKLPQGTWGVQVDGAPYEFSRWGAEESLDRLMDLTAIIGGPVGGMLALMMGKPGDARAEVTPDVAGTLVRELGIHMHQHRRLVLDLFRKLAADGVICRGKPVNFDEHYANNLGHLFRVTRAALEVQYGNFFAEALAAAGMRRVPAASPSTPAPSTSDGKSGPSSAPA